jgi:hypothetical protein
MSAASRRHDIRDDGGKYAKAKDAKAPSPSAPAKGTPAAPAPSPHHGAVQSTYQGAQVAKTGGFKPHQDGQATTPAGELPSGAAAAPSGL